MPEIDPLSLVIGLLTGWFVGSVYFGIWKNNDQR